VFMEKRVIVLAIMLLLYPLYAACSYVPGLEVMDERVTTLYPNAGDRTNLSFTVASNEIYIGDVEIYLESDGFTYPLKEEMVYLTPGNNTFKYELQLPVAVPDGLYFMHITADGFDYIIPLTLKSGRNVTQWVGEDLNNKTLSVAFTGLDESVEVQYYARSYNGQTENKHYYVEPVNGSVVVVDRLCENCKLTLLLGYGGTVAKVERVYGIYSEPYVRITEFDRKHVVFESCAQGTYSTYVDGQLVGTERGIGRIEKALSTGYEKVAVKLEGENANLLERSIDLGLITPKNITLNLYIAKKSPFEIRITARDEFGRDVESEGYLVIQDPAGNNYTERIEFVGEYVERINLADGNYKVYYEGQYAEGSAVAEEYEAPKPEVGVKTPIPQDFVPALVVILILALIILVWAWLKRWKRNV